tara:strand:+ start:138 stop:803 length:666 start_codon:yes stop_codon:yes gene_type:complete
MPKTYFRQLPDLDYINRDGDDKSISDFIKVKNLFKRGRLREDIFQDTTFFEKYQIEGDDRPDNVSNKFYGSENLDWVVLLSNNILNIQSEWPMTQQSFDEYLLDKYGSIEKINEVHHYESVEVKNSEGVVMFPAGKRIDEDQSINFYDGQTLTTVSNISKEITNLVHETKLNEDKRNIFLLKGIYLGVVLDDMEEMMQYKKGSTQFVNGSLKRVDNIRLFN